MLAKVDGLAKTGPVFVTGDFKIAARTDASHQVADLPLQSKPDGTISTRTGGPSATQPGDS